MRIFQISLLAVLLASCSSPVQRPNSSAKDCPKGALCSDPGGAGKDGGDADSEVDVDGDGIPDVDGVPSALSINTPKRIWRLTPEQYANTADALLQRTTKIEAKFDSDTVPEDGFGNEASVLGISTIFASNIESAVSAVIKESAASLEKQLSCGKAASINDQCLNQFIDEFGAKAFRRPLEDDEKKRFQTLYNALQKDLGNAEALSAVAEAIMRSPHTLFRTELGDGAKSGAIRLTPYELATALSFALTNSPPDAQLLAKAADGSLADNEVYLAEAKRLISSPSFVTGMTQFMSRWRGIRWLPHVDKNKEMFPNYDANTKLAMIQEANDFVSKIVKDNKSSFTAFMTSNKTTITPPLAPIYGIETFTGSKAIEAKAGERSGFLTLPGVMATNSSSNQTGPVHRGVFLLKKLMCLSMPPPPPDASTVLPETDATLTLRERFKAHSTEPSCAVCHVKLDPFGFAMEHYDPIGRYRAMDNGRPVDASGTITGTKFSNASFKNAIDMLEGLSKSEDVHSCFVKNTFRYVFGRTEGKDDKEQLAEALKAFTASNLDMSTIFLNFVTSDSFKTRKANP